MSTHEPARSTPAQVTAATWACVRDRRILVVRTIDQDAFYLPGGTPESGETLQQTTAREVLEETCIELRPEDLTPLIEVTADAHGRPGMQVRLVCFTATTAQDPTPAAEIDEIAWFTTADLPRCAPAVREVLLHLAAARTID